MPLMRPLFGVLKPKVQSRYSKIRYNVKKKLYRGSADASIDEQWSTQDLAREGGGDWGLRVPGSQTMKSIDISMARTHGSSDTQGTGHSLSENRDDKRTVTEWV